MVGGGGQVSTPNCLCKAPGEFFFPMVIPLSRIGGVSRIDGPRIGSFELEHSSNIHREKGV